MLGSFGQRWSIALIVSLVVIGAIAAGFVIERKAEETGYTIHERLWEETFQKAKTDKYSKYAVYAARILAVKHPEVYLQGDAIFVKTITSESGYQKAYMNRDVYDEDFFLFLEGFTGPPFSFSDVDFKAYTIASSSEAYPENYPLFPFLDRRLLPIASTLKCWENVVTQLELGEQFFFALRENGVSEDLYLIYCDNEETYIYDNGELTWMRNLASVEEIAGNPILVFNENYAWYPLMERDDRSKDPILNDIVERYSTDVKSPNLTEKEEGLIQALKGLTDLNEENQFLMATLAAAHTEATFNSWRIYLPYIHFRDLWTKLNIPWWARGVFQEIYKRANLMSPITSHLVWISRENKGEGKIEAISKEYLRHAAIPGRTYAWGEIWPCSLSGQTIDECYRTRSGHCIWQAASISAVLDAMELNNFIISGYSPGEVSHTWIYVPEHDLVVSDGRPSIREVMFPGYAVIIFISQRGKWAHPVAGYYGGTLSPKETISMLDYLSSLHGENIQGFNGYSVITYTELIERLNRDQEYWRPIELP